MSFINIYLQAFALIMIFMTLIWFISIIIKNVSIVDIFWGLGFVAVCIFYFMRTEGFHVRKIILLSLVTIWGLRLSIYLAWRNIGKGEDFRYREFRRKYGDDRYWWVSYFQTFVLQGVLMWMISAPLLGAQYSATENRLGIFDYCGILLWFTGIIFEAGGDRQLARFKADPANAGKVMTRGLWRYTRHPNYFGDSAIWWGYGFICLASGSMLPVLGSLIMTILIIKVSGVVMLEKSLAGRKPEYKDYAEKTSAFFPWFPKKIIK
jgi:steroid 5-alpha reductase family enzyme